MRQTRLTVLVVLVALLVGCAGMQATTSLDQAIQYRGAFNTLLSQWNTELAGMPQPMQREWAQKAVPVVQAGVLALDTIDVMAGAGGTITADNVQVYLTSKNKLIDLISQLILAKKGVK